MAGQRPAGPRAATDGRSAVGQGPAGRLLTFVPATAPRAVEEVVSNSTETKMAIGSTNLNS